MRPKNQEDLWQELQSRAEAIASGWYEIIVRRRSAFIPRSTAEIRLHLADLTKQGLELLCSDPIQHQAIRDFGKALAQQRYLSLDDLSSDVDTLVQIVTGGLTSEQTVHVHRRVATIVADIAAGIAEQMRDTILVDQEELRTALIAERLRTEHALHRSEEMARVLLNAPGDAAALIDANGTIIAVNDMAAQLAGIPESDLIGTSLQDVIPPSLLKSRTGWVRQVIDTGKPLRLESESAYGLHFSYSFFPVFDADGKVRRLAYFARDITERKRREKEIRRRNQEMAALYAISSSIGRSLNLDHILDGSLDQIMQLDLLGEGGQGMIFLRDDDQDARTTLAAHRQVPDDHPCLTTPLSKAECLCGRAAQRGETITSEDCWQDERHSRRWLQMEPHKDISVPLKVRGAVVGVMHLHISPSKEIRDHDLGLLDSISGQISVAIENARLFEESRQRGERLSVLSAKLAEVQEDEREQLARELHDQVGQSLTALNLNLHVVQSRLPEDADDMARACLDDSLEMVRQTTARIRGVMSDLRPQVLDDHGLVAALEWYADQSSTRLGFPINVEGEQIIPRLARAVEIALFRITQEALTNAARHAYPTQVAITVDERPATVSLTIADDGIGFDVDQRDSRDGKQRWGLAIMAQRAEAVGGHLHIESRLGAGTHLTVEVPR